MKYLIGIILFFVVGCSDKEKETEQRVIVIQPLGDFSESISSDVGNKIRSIDPNTEIRKNIPLPRSAFYKLRQRYRADSLISYLRLRVGKDTVIVGLTEQDISTTKGAYQDWGIMGLGYCPGRACVVSRHRLKGNKEEQLYKVVLHELGHTEGLPHCSVETCFMRDAEGGNPLDSEKEFCRRCRNYLVAKGWQIN